MNGKHKAYRDFLFMVISLFLLVTPAFHECHDLMDFELLSSPSFENRHLEDMALGQSDKWQGIASSVSSVMLLLSIIFFTQAFQNTSPVSSLHQQTPVLRC
jgi:hypothetical protein